MLHLLRLNHLLGATLPIRARETGAGSLRGRDSSRQAGERSGAGVTLEAIAIVVERNGYGRQRESFVDILTPTDDWVDHEPLEGVFIRAPRITAVEGGARVLF